MHYYCYYYYSFIHSLHPKSLGYIVIIWFFWPRMNICMKDNICQNVNDWKFKHVFFFPLSQSRQISIVGCSARTGSSYLFESLFLIFQLETQRWPFDLAVNLTGPQTLPRFLWKGVDKNNNCTHHLGIRNPWPSCIHHNSQRRVSRVTLSTHRGFQNAHLRV